MMHNKRGFTLVEVLIVVFIIGLLSSIVLVGLGSFRARGRDARRIADLHQVQNALELYYAKESTYPNASSWQELTSALVGGGIGVTVVPNDPSSGKEYDYGVNTDGLSYVLGATLEDTNNPVLRTDVDAATYGVECSDPAYCIQL